MTEPNIPIVPGHQTAEAYPYGPPSPHGIHVTAQLGLGSGLHTANIILSILTCGGWLPFYLLIALLMPAKRVRVVAPFGTPPHLIDEARRQAMQLTPAEKGIVKSRNQGLIAAAITVGCIIAAFAVLFLLSQD